MPAIINPQAIVFCNEVLRPLAEQTRALKARITAANVTWGAGLNAVFTNDSSVVTDNRTAEGVSTLTGADIQQLMSGLLAVSAAVNDQVISKPCVRPIQVT